MHPIRAKLRARLVPAEIELDDWLYQLANEETPENLEAMQMGLMFRCMTIASLHPDWSFFGVMAEAKRTLQAEITVPDLLETRPA